MAARIPQQNVILRAPTQANRRPLDTFPAYMRQLGQTVLDGHHDIKFHKGAEQRATAASWASRRGLTLGPDVDINDDGVNDVVLYTSEGVPVVINGYALEKSEFMLRKKFQEANPDAGARIRVGGYSGFKKTYRNDPAKDAYQNTFRPGFAKLRKSPVRAEDAGDSLYKQFTNKIKTIFIPMMNEQAAAVNNDIAELPGKVLPVSSISAFYYTFWFLRYLWQHADMAPYVNEIRRKYRSAAKRSEMFRKAISKHADIVAQIIEADDVWEHIDEDCANAEERIPELAEMGFDAMAFEQGIADGEVPLDANESFKARAWRAMIKESLTRQIQYRKEVETEAIFGNADHEEMIDGLLDQVEQ